MRRRAAPTPALPPEPGHPPSESAGSPRPLHAAALDVLLECLQFSRPRGLDVLEPVAQPIEVLRSQPVDAHPGVLLERVLVHQATPAEDTLVATHRGRADGERRSELPGAARPPPQEVDGASPCAVRERDQGAVERVHVFGERRRCMNHQWWPSTSSASYERSSQYSSP